jgi:hypothetical protein
MRWGTASIGCGIAASVLAACSGQVILGQPTECGPGTVYVSGVCVLAPIDSSIDSPSPDVNAQDASHDGGDESDATQLEPDTGSHDVSDGMFLDAPGESCVAACDGSVADATDAQQDAAQPDVAQPDVQHDAMALDAETGTPTATLVLHYMLNGDARDASGNGYDGSIFGARATWDRGGEARRAMMFVRGSSQYVYRASAAKLPTAKRARTLALWLRTTMPASGSVSNDMAVANWGSATTGRRFGLMVRDGKPYVVGESRDYAGVKPINDGAWHHVAVDYDGAVSRLYVDGVQDARVSVDWDTGDTNFVVGRAIDGHLPAEFFEGDIDDVRVYDGLLSPIDVRELAMAAPCESKVGLHAIGAAVGKASASALWNLGSQMSVEYWVKFRTQPAPSNVAVSTAEDDSITGGWLCSFDVNEGLWMSIRYADPAGSIKIPVVVDSGRWHHVSCQYDGATMRVFLNGALVGSKAAAGPIDDSGRQLYVLSRNQFWANAGSKDYVVRDIRIGNVNLRVLPFAPEIELGLVSGTLALYPAREGRGVTLDSTIPAPEITLSGAIGWQDSCWR